MAQRDQVPLERTPAWSQALTDPLGRAIPIAWRAHVLIGIKALHTAIFASVAACIGVFVWEGIRQRPGPRAATALGVALAETAVFVSNNQVCPLTPLAEDLGADDGSVADIFLPEWASRRIPLIGGGALLLGVALHLVAVLGRQRRTAHPAIAGR